VIELSTYRLELLWSDKELNLYRGSSEHDRSQILVLSPAVEYPAPETLKRLEHEYSLREELESTWAARPIAIAQHWNRTVLVLEDPGGVPLDQLLGQPLQVAFALRLAIGLSGVINRLHQRGIIHKDIKPANVLADPLTGRCWLKGFGIASRLPRERQSAEPPELVAGTLAYMAPEQTGRMNRSTDSRSDLYALGVSLYEMLTGTLPFTASDPMEWVHCHIARKPVPPEEHSRRVPASLSAIVMKLLAKTAEERYQTAAGVEGDLQRCLDEWQIQGQVAEFKLGKHDISDQLLIPEKLYGRRCEIDILLASFERVVTSGRPELIIVSGYSGIGKSSVVNELHKVLVPQRGFFASGKFDQYKRDIPYSTLAEAFQGLIRQLLVRSDAELIRWRDVFREALGPNGQLIVDLVPELALILGQQPPVPELAAQDAQRRFQLVFRRFLTVFARPEHPLVLFLDDLQWLDAATLDLLEDVSTQSDVQHLMLIGACRDNEVDHTHPLVRKLESIRQAGAIVQETVLTPLSCEDSGRLIADSLHYESENGRSEGVTSLAQLVHEKTGGNPFFAIQFLSTLAEEGLLTFDHDAARWSWDLTRIHAKGYTDNVVDLMVGKLNRLPVKTQKSLMEFACLGSSAEIAALSIIHGRVLASGEAGAGLVLPPVRHSLGDGGSPGQPDEGGTSEAELHADLWDALRLEFIVRSGGSYKFVHDRVQEAAYSLVPEELRAETHLRIGRLLTKHTPSERLEETVFEIVNQLDRGAVLLSSQEEREQLAELNLIAGKRAKDSTAFASALKYLAAGASLLDESAWDRRHELVFALELPRAECEFLTGQTLAANERLIMLSSRAIDMVELAAVTCLRIDHCTALDQIARAVDVFLDYFRRLGVEWSRHPTVEEGRREYQRIWSQLGTRTIEELVDLPLMADPASLGTLDVLSKIYVPAVFTDANLLSWTVCYAVNLSLERGNCDASCLAYVWLGKIAGAYFGDHQAGVRFGQLSQELIEKRNLKRFQAQTHLWFAQNIAPLTSHLRSCRELIRWAFETATKSGEITTASYTFDILITNLLAAGDPLIEAQRHAEDGIAFSGRTRSGFGSDLISGQLGFIRSLRGLNEEFGHLDDGEHSEAQLERHVADQLPDRTVPACWYWIRKLQARFFSGNYVSAIAAAEKARPLLWSSPANFETVEYHFFSALSHAAVCDAGTSDKQRRYLEIVIAHHRQLETWAKNCPENFANRAALVGAEIARIEGRIADAMDLYEQAIRSAQANGFVHNEALANELAARFFFARGFEKIANNYLRDARYGFVRWGADGKVRQLDELFPHLSAAEPAPGPTTTIGASAEQLDLGTVVKVYQAVSEEIVLERLIETLMKIAIEHAGAERGLLILPFGQEYRIAAEARTHGDRIEVKVQPVPSMPSEFPDSLLRYVLRTQESVILDDASTQTQPRRPGRIRRGGSVAGGLVRHSPASRDEGVSLPGPDEVGNLFAEDQYVLRQRPRSILCLPLVKQAKLVGVLYLENNLAPGVFTPQRLAMLELLASQAAISLDHARIYADLIQENNDRRKAEEALRASEERWSVLAENSSAGIALIAPNGRFIAANLALQKMLGYTEAELKNRTAASITHEEDRAATEDRARIAEIDVQQRRVYHLEKRFLCKDGKVLWADVSTVFVPASGDGPAFFTVVIIDISKRKRAEEALQKAQTELAHVSRVTTMGELAASIAHEVNQPLVGVVTNASASLRYLGWDTPNLVEAKEAIRAIIRDGNRAADVISRMRGLFKKASPAKELIKINEAIDEVVLITQGEARKKKVMLRSELAGNLPAVMADRVQIQQVLMNLILNGIQAMSSVEDRERVLVVRTQAGEGNEVRVTVQDCGVGIDPENFERIFDAFHTTKPGGMGMGLSISRSIVESHGGRLWASPNDGPGVTFEFTL
jgi:PAS domain S-box-containing protein